MTDQNVPTSGYEINAERMPVVSIKDGQVFANSRDVAAYFGKRHDDVMKAIRNLIGQQPSLGLRNFAETPYVEPQNGQTYKSFDIDRDGFALLAMGFTGEKALGFKLKYIEQFNAMESALKSRATGFVVPRTLAEALRLAADQADTIDRQKIELAVAAPKLDVYNRIANSDGLFNLTHAAKVLQQPPRAFIQRLQAEGWIYKRAGSDRWTAYQDKIYRGFLEHKTTTVTRPDGTEKTVDQVMVTAKGIVKLGAMFGVDPLLEVTQAAE